MRRRTWDAKRNALRVLEGLKGTPVAESGTAHQISPSLSEQWRAQCLAHAAKAFDDPQRPRKAARLGQENARLEWLVGERACELKDSDEFLA